MYSPCGHKEHMTERLSLLLFYVICGFFFFFSREACGVFAPQPRVKPAPPALKGKGLTAGLPGKSLKIHFGLNYQKYSIHENGIKRKM